MKSKMLVLVLILALFASSNSVAFALNGTVINADAEAMLRTEAYDGLVITSNNANAKTKSFDVAKQTAVQNGIESEYFVISTTIESIDDFNDKTFYIGTQSGSQLSAAESDAGKAVSNGYIKVVDAEEGVVATIGETVAFDAKGNNVDVVAVNSGNNISYSLVSDEEDITFPVMVVTSAHPTQYYYEYLTVFNTSLEREKLYNAWEIINDRMNDPINSYISAVIGIFGLFHITTGVASLVITGMMGSTYSFWAQCENVYFEIIRDFDLQQYVNVRITYAYRGEWEDPNKQYVYTALVPTKVYNVETAEG